MMVDIEMFRFASELFHLSTLSTTDKMAAASIVLRRRLTSQILFLYLETTRCEISHRFMP